MQKTLVISSDVSHLLEETVDMQREHQLWAYSKEELLLLAMNPNDTTLLDVPGGDDIIKHCRHYLHQLLYEYHGAYKQVKSVSWVIPGLLMDIVVVKED